MHDKAAREHWGPISVKDQDSRNVLGIGPLHKIYVLIQILFDSQADDVNAGGFQVSKVGILV